jgi:hypothetical protein
MGIVARAPPHNHAAETARSASTLREGRRINLELGVIIVGAQEMRAYS